MPKIGTVARRPGRSDAMERARGAGDDGRGPPARRLRYVFVATDDVLHACLGTFAFVRPGIATTLLRKDVDDNGWPGIAALLRKDRGNNVWRRVEVGELRSTTIRGYKMDRPNLIERCLGCVLREAVVPDTGTVAADVDRFFADNFAAERGRDLLSTEKDMFVFPHPWRVLFHVVEVLSVTTVACRMCVTHYKITGHWSEAGVHWDREQRIALQSPVIVSYQDYVQHRTTITEYDHGRDSMYRCYLPPNGVTSLWRTPITEEVLRVPFSRVGEVVTAVALITDSKTPRLIAHTLFPRLARRVIEGLQLHMRGARLDAYVVDAGEWTHNERALVEFITAYWPDGTAWRSDDATAFAGESFHDTTRPLREPMPEIKSPQVRIAAAMRRILARGIPRHDDKYVEETIAREVCARSFIADSVGVLTLLRDDFYRPTLSLLRHPRVLDEGVNPVAVAMGKVASDDPWEGRRALALRDKNNHCRVIVPTSRMFDSPAWWFCGASPELRVLHGVYSNVSGGERTAYYFLKAGLLKSELDRPLSEYASVPSEDEENAWCTRHGVLTVHIVFNDNLRIETSGPQRQAVIDSQGKPRIDAADGVPLEPPTFCRCVTNEGDAHKLTIELPKITEDYSDFVKAVFTPVSNRLASKGVSLAEPLRHALTGIWRDGIVAARPDAAADRLVHVFWLLTQFTSHGFVDIVVQLAAIARARGIQAVVVVQERVNFQLPDNQMTRTTISAWTNMVNFFMGVALDVGGSDVFADVLLADLKMRRVAFPPSLRDKIDDVARNYASTPVALSHNNYPRSFFTDTTNRRKEWNVCRPVAGGPLHIVSIPKLRDFRRATDAIHARALAISYGRYMHKAQQYFLVIAVAQAHKQAGFFKNIHYTGARAGTLNRPIRGGDVIYHTCRRDSDRLQQIAQAGQTTARDLWKRFFMAPFLTQEA